MECPEIALNINIVISDFLFTASFDVPRKMGLMQTIISKEVQNHLIYHD